MVSRAATALIGQKEEIVTGRFTLDIDGLWIASFKEVSGLSGTIEVDTWQEGGLNEYEHKFPKRVTYGNVTLKSGVANSIDFWNWFESVASGRVQRRDVSVILYTQDQGESMRWNISGAFPVSWQGPDLSGGDNQIAVHSLELAHQGISFNRPLLRWLNSPSW